MKTRPSQCQIKLVPGLTQNQYRIQIQYKNRMVLSQIIYRDQGDSRWSVYCDLWNYVRDNFHPDDVRIILKAVDDFYRKYDRAKHIRTVQDETRRLIDTL